MHDVSKHVEENSGSESDSLPNRNFYPSQSEDNLETESEAPSRKETSNPQGPESTEPHPKMPIQARRAIELYGEVLTDYEQSEILGNKLCLIDCLGTE